MNTTLKEISQISIYLKDEVERVNEVALFQPLQQQAKFQENLKPLHSRKWSPSLALSFMEQLVIKFYHFIFKRIPSCIPSERLTSEAKFKTALALLLEQENIRDFFLSNPKRRKNFLLALKEAAHSFGYLDFSIQDESDDPLQISKNLTRLPSKKRSLIEDPVEFHLQKAALHEAEQNEILFTILNKIERPPITSVLEITSNNFIESIPFTTQYAKYKILYSDPPMRKIIYSCSENFSTSSIRTLKNSVPDSQGVMNQHLVYEGSPEKNIGSYCGELSTSFHVLEQILFILQEKSGEVAFHDDLQSENAIEKKILFTSLFSWNEMDQIATQREAIRQWDHKILKSGTSYYRLKLLYFNIPFNVLNKYPTPAESKSLLQDINDEALIFITSDLWHYFNLKSETLETFSHTLEILKRTPHFTFAKREKGILEMIDAFKGYKENLIKALDELHHPLGHALKALLTYRKPEKKNLRGMDQLIYLNYIAQSLSYYHNKNCQNAPERCAGADAADKALNAYHKFHHLPFLPGYESQDEHDFFKILYSIYLVWEEPEINIVLDTGLVTEKNYNNLIQKNPESNRYLLYWLTRHPEIYSI